MRLSYTSIIGIDALYHLLRTEQPVCCDHRPFPMHPLGLNGIEPRAFTRQTARQEAHAPPGLLDVVIVLPQPGTHLVADVPRRVVPDQQHGGEPLRRQPLAAPGASTRLHRHSRGPMLDGARPEPSAGRAVFFRRYAGSGLVIQCLARCQRTPRRASARRMASPLIGRCVRPSAYATSAAKAKVHRLVGWPKV